MKFNSQICTTKEQSERLLALGLKKETADMRYQIRYLDLGGVLKECTPPHWSHILLSITIGLFLRGRSIG